MATLNLRDRLLEAKIAYVGAALAGKSANLAHLRGAREAGRVASDQGATLDFRPLRLGAFDDCELSVQLSDDWRADRADFDDLDDLDDLDGVVFVVDSAPHALEANRAAAARLRERLGRRAVHVLVQFNKRDLPDALAEESLAAALGVADWPRVVASAASGHGVTETLERAIEGVLAMMKQSELDTPHQRHGATEANPLLSALRSVLEGAIRDQMQDLEARLQARLDVAIEDAHARALAELRGSIDEAVRSAEAAQRSAEAAQRSADAVPGALSATVSAAQAEANRKADALEASVQRQREQVATTLAPLQRTLDAVVAELRRADQQSRTLAEAQTTRLLTALAKTSESSDAVLGSLSPVSVEVVKIAERLDTLLTLEPRLTRLVDDRAQKVVSALDARTAAAIGQSAREAATGIEVAAQRLEERTAAIAAQLDELIEELKKRKKGWFG